MELKKYDFLSSNNVKLILCEAPIYSVKEQFELIRKIPKDTDVMWSPHYNIPIFYRGKLLVTVHDVFHLAMPQFVNGIHKRLYAKFMFQMVKKKADKIICVSKFTANELKKYVNEENILMDKSSGKDLDRPAYQALKGALGLREGDTLIITSLDRLSRDKEDIKNELQWFQNKKVRLKILDLPTSLIEVPDGQQWILDMIQNILIEVLSSIAEQERLTIKKRQKEGIEAAKAKGKHLGRPSIEQPKEFAEIYLNKAKAQIANLTSEEIVKYVEPRLKYFIDTTKSEEIKDFFDELDYRKNLAHKELWVSSLNTLTKSLGPTIANGMITRKDQNHILGEISRLEAKIDTYSIPEDASSMLLALKEKIIGLTVNKKAETLKDEQGYSIASTASETLDYSVAISKMFNKKASKSLSEQKRASNLIRQYSKFGNEHQVMKFLAAANLIIAAIKAKKEYYINFDKVNRLIIQLVQEAENKYPNLSIIIDDLSLIFDLYGIQFSFYLVPISNKERKIIESRSNKVTEVKHQRSHLYANEIFNLVAPKSTN